MVFERLRNIGVEAAHPLLVPGIIAELELMKHVQLVDNLVSEVEEKVLELNLQPNYARELCRDEVDRRNIAKRTAWLDLKYLSNSLTSWSNQLLKMLENIQLLEREKCLEWSSATDNRGAITSYALPVTLGKETSVDTGETGMGAGGSRLKLSQEEQPKFRVEAEEPMNVKHVEDAEAPASGGSSETFIPEMDHNLCAKDIQKTSKKITGRLMAIREEYEEKIRECTMRLDGMAMGTQWVNSPPPKLVVSLLILVVTCRNCSRDRSCH
jgi:hypothetical protein